MKNRHGEGALVLALFAAFSACSDPAEPTVAPAPSPDIVASANPGQQSEERAALTKIARLVAISLNDEPARQQLKSDMRAAPFREHNHQLPPQLRAISLNEQQARQQLKRDMRAAPVREHKLELAPFLRSKEGESLLARM